MRRIKVLQFVIVLVILAVCSTVVPAAEKAPVPCCAEPCSAKAGQLHLKVDFTVVSSKDDPKPIPGTTKEGWWHWVIPDWDQYRSDLKWEDGSGKYPNGKLGIAGSGVHAAITNHYEGLLTVSVAGMRRYLAGGIQPINKPIDGPICNTWVEASDFPSNPSSDLLLSFYDLPAGKYRLKSYHNNYNGRRAGNSPTGVEYEEQKNPEPPMPSIKVYPMKSVLKDYFKRTEDAQVKGQSYGTPENKMMIADKLGTGDVKQTLEAKDVVIQQVRTDAELKPSIIEFTTDGSPLVVVYSGGCCKKDDLRRGRTGGYAILNAFELIELPSVKSK
ncbi:MAG: hypothetical protein E4H40_01795 [Candidatus Brocadiia bacterium]|nr:MAG: hypothetical protein E4H40_01795 [Candidatus Brocadiia bacterium]